VTITFRSDTCGKCKNASWVSFRVEPEEAWKLTALNRWRRPCPGCFDAEAGKAGVRYSFVGLDAMSWLERPAPKRPSRPKRR
jgi:hypothetical protein